MAEPAIASAFAPQCVSIDLEVGPQDGRIHRFAAIRGDTGDVLRYQGGDLQDALRRLDDLASGAAFLLGHNLTAFDRAHLEAANPGLRLLALPDVDTLRLNPLAFPQNPYHHLVKHYQDGQLSRGRLNDPELDARLTLDLFRDQRDALLQANQQAPQRLAAWHYLTTLDGSASGMNAFFASVRRRTRPSLDEARAAIRACLADCGCAKQTADILGDERDWGWPLAYALAWLSVAGGNSVMPPWVRHAFPEAVELVRRLRDTPCFDADCGWCRARHDAVAELRRWFGFDAYRATPAGPDGKSRQQAIAEAALQGRHALGLLPTGTGKSVCYQVPALSRYDKTGALTVVISPLVALMADQVEGLERRGISSCAAVNGLLSMPERKDVLDRLRLGDLAIVIISPEQLRNRSVRRALAQREIGAWVLDEAHCLSKWGHDFRPDYRYVGRFIRERSGEGPIAPILCLTATAKQDVVRDIVGHFREKLGVELEVFDGGTDRTNLDFVVVPTSMAGKLAQISQVLNSDLPAGLPGGAIVYCASRRRTEEVAQYLRDKGLAAEHFHAGLSPERKKDVQGRFVRGDLRVIVATNAFGMGIDKPDVRLVIHADIPGSLENYLQEAGRAGRDQQAARCVLLYTPEDVEWQFGLSARSRLTQQEIAAILKSLRQLDRRKRLDGEVVATPGEILAEEEQGVFERDSATDDTRVRTAVSWLEEAGLLQRDENDIRVFPSSLRVQSVEDARRKLDRVDVLPTWREPLLRIVGALIDADPDEGVTTDELMAVSGLGSEKIRAALYDLERLGIASNDAALTAFVHVGVERASRKRLEEAAALESALIDALQESAPDLQKGEQAPLNVRRATQMLKDAGHAYAIPERIWRILRSLAADGRDEGAGAGSIALRALDAETAWLKLQRGWTALRRTAGLRRTAAARILDHLLARLPQGERGVDLLASTTLGALQAAVVEDVVLTSSVNDPVKLIDRALLWLHEQEVIRLNRGLTVFRQAMTIRLAEDRRNFVKADFAPLRAHYDEQVVQIHVMAEFAERGLSAMADALRLAMDYFSLDRQEFLGRWLPGRQKEIERQTTPASWQAVVESLQNPVQQRIVADDREQTNVLVLAGPGSGKTRVLVHRIAYLIRVRRENPRGIIALAYNRHAAVEIRRRLRALIGDDAQGVVVMTCHALAMRLAGVSFAGRSPGDEAFREVLRQAVALLRGDGMPPDEADAQRSRLLAGFRWILVDEYQDVGPEQYELIAALAGRALEEEDGRLTLFAVGDDDQNIYGFAGASVEYIRRFEADYRARAAFLLENYRSTAHIVAAANRVIALAAQRMKVEHPVTVDRARQGVPAGGAWARLDPVARGRVQVIHAGDDSLSQAVAVVAELRRLAVLDPEWDWARVAVIAREWQMLDPVRALCVLEGISVQVARDEAPHFWRLRETQALVAWLRQSNDPLLHPDRVRGWFDDAPRGPWNALLLEALDHYAEDTLGESLPVQHFIEWLAEWGREVRRRQDGLLLVTAHRAKGLEFDHVIVLDGTWEKSSEGEDPDAARRLYYVAMTRARHTLTLTRLTAGNQFVGDLVGSPEVLVRERPVLPRPPAELAVRHERLSLRDIDLGFAGRFRAEHAVHGAIRGLAAGAALGVRIGDRGLEFLAPDGQTVVGRVARSYRAPRGVRCVGATVIAIVVRERDDSDPEYRDLCKVDRWEAVVPELILEPVRDR